MKNMEEVRKHPLANDSLFIEDVKRLWDLADMWGVKSIEKRIERLARLYNTDVETVKLIGGF